MFQARYKGLRLIPSRSAMREMVHEGKSLFDVLEVLEEGYEAPRKRKEGTIEKWLDRGNKTYNAVIARDYDEIMRKEIWRLIHFGKFTKK